MLSHLYDRAYFILKLTIEKAARFVTIVFFVHTETFDRQYKPGFVCVF